VAVARRSNGERAQDLETWWRLVVKAQRGRIATRLAASDRRIAAARVDAMEDWDGGRTGGKKPSLDYYDARRW
jgi:hypothetical protein